MEIDSLRYIYGEDVTANGDGTFTLSLSPWCERPMCGFVSEEFALLAAEIVHEAMREYCSGMYED